MCDIPFWGGKFKQNTEGVELLLFVVLLLTLAVLYINDVKVSGLSVAVVDEAGVVPELMAYLQRKGECLQARNPCLYEKDTESLKEALDI